MNYGPLEFADYLRRKGDRPEPATVRAARAAQPVSEPLNLLRVVSVAGGAARMIAEPGNVYEAVALPPPGAAQGLGSEVRVRVRPGSRPLVLVLSAQHPVKWLLSLQPGAALAALLLSGFGRSTVSGVQGVPVHRIGGYCAFRRGSAEFRHLECEVLRCAGRSIARFDSVYAGGLVEVG